MITQSVEVPLWTARVYARGQKSKITYGMFSSVVVTVGDFLGLDVTTRSES